MKILGISAYYHDAAAAIIDNGHIIAAAQEERFTRIKHDPSFPFHAIKYCLRESGFSIDELDAVCFYDKPFLKFERLLETYYGLAPKGVVSFIKAVPIWVKEKLFLKSNIRKNLKEIEEFNVSELKLLFPEHHLSHAASAFYPSPFDEAAILTIDGVGEWATASICTGKGKDITVQKELKFPHSIGLLYSSFTYFLGFKVNSGEYKMMGLAPYGNADSDAYQRFRNIIESKLIKVQQDGSLWLNLKYFSYPTGLRMVVDKKWMQLLGISRRAPGDPILQEHMDLALAIQHITEEIVVMMAKEAKRISGSSNLCLAGGVALNCVANGKLLESGIFDRVWIQPAAGDAGGALGCALAAHHIFFGKELIKPKAGDRMQGAYLGPEYPNASVLETAKKYKANYKVFDYDRLYDIVAGYIADAQVIGWFQGRMEFGPRALGHRSIIADARNPEMQRKLNLKIKYRESFRPFAPSVLREEVGKYFDLEEDSPYMLIVKNIVDQLKVSQPENFNSLSLHEKLNTTRSEIPAVTHVDYSARIQTVDGQHNPHYYHLIKAFKKLTGCGLIINTSFNVRGEPIICTPEDAYRCFMRTEMDVLVINNIVFIKKEQPEWHQTDNWKETFELD